MLGSFLQFVLDVFGGMIELFQYTELGGFTLENVLSGRKYLKALLFLLLSLLLRLLLVLLL